MNQGDWLRKRYRQGKRLGCAPEIGAFVLLGLAGLFAMKPALAVDPSTPGESAPQSVAKTLSDYLADLGGDDAPERLYAARTIRGEERRALWAIDHAPADSLAALDAQSILVEVEARIPMACRSALLYTNTVPLCAEILADLGHAELLPEVRTARTRVSTKGAIKRVDAAIVRLEALALEAAPIAAPLVLPAAVPPESPITKPITAPVPATLPPATEAASAPAP
ncbi:hypothetical protein LBMAG42_28220 [Deltaproteobacteria bacterium]|nr:hypothetical protein LBMAG42_28220 [Deltaproteobacteria bacterium]